MQIDNITADDLSLLTTHLDLGRAGAPHYDPDTLVATFPASASAAVAALVADPDWRDGLRAAPLVAYAATKRRSVISAGCVVHVAGVDVPVWADADSQAALTALVVASQMQPAIAAPWRGRDGLTYTLDATDIATLAMGVMAFVQTAFSVNAQLDAAIDAGTLTTTAAIDAAAWPPTDTVMPSP